MLFEIFLSLTIIFVILFLAFYSLGRKAYTPKTCAYIAREIAPAVQAAPVVREKLEEEKLVEEEFTIIRDMIIWYHKTMYVGKDYELIIKFVKVGAREIPPSEEVEEIKEEIKFTAKEPSPKVKISVSSTAFKFNVTEKEVIIPQEDSSEPAKFIVTPIEGMGGKRKISLSVSYEDTVIKDIILDIEVKDHVADHLTYKHMKMITLMNVAISIITGIFSIITFLMNL